ncbi:hypothetical protein EIP91_001156 [Steccherinum ochraceum]|uniref:Peptidase A1 domain-containing protein n=1 Tax=Steccherinum ochraceum TaxID=92696 RepID=A0A4R0RN05_9APHY|nr:hypothetical protein EIP91_001156 [Steccherinum ochraceum]
MLTIAFVLFALQLSATASPSPAFGGVHHIELTRRRPLNATRNAPVDIEKLSAETASILGKYDAGFDAFLENTGKTHSLVDSITNNNKSKRAVGNSQIVDDGDSLWIGLLAIGTSNPQQTFIVGFDTGSASTLVLSSACTSADCQPHRRYNPALSSTSRNLNKPFTLKMSNTDSVSGAQYADTVKVDVLQASGQVFGAANAFPKAFKTYPNEPGGLVGMAYGSISAYKGSTSFPQTLVAQGAMTDPVFAFRLTSGSGSQLTIGGTDQAAYTGAVTYVPVTSRGFWQVTLDGVTVSIPPGGGGVAAPPQTAVGRTQAILDTGSQYIIGDPGNVAKLYAAIPGSAALGNGMYSYPCATSPTVSLVFGGVAFPIDPSLFCAGSVPQNGDLCVGAVVAAPQTKPPQRFWSVGDVFLQNVYSIFDLGQNRVGFATPA